MKLSVKEIVKVVNLGAILSAEKKAEIIKVISLAIIYVFIPFVIIAEIFLYDFSNVRIWSAIILCLIAIGNLIFLNKNLIVAASHNLVFGFWIVLLILILELGGIRVPLFSAFIVVVLLAALLINIRSSVLTAVASIVTGIVIIEIETSGIIEFKSELITYTETFIIYFVLIIITLFILYLFSKQLNETITELRKNEAYNRRLFNGSPVGILIIDESGKILDSNPSSYQLFEKTQKELMESVIWDYFEKEIQVDLRRKFKQVIRTNKLEKFESEIICAKNNKKNISIYAQIHKMSGINNIRLTLEDVTKVKIAQEKINSTLEELQQWYDVSIDREERIRELKSEVNDLLIKQNKSKKYLST